MYRWEGCPHQHRGSIKHPGESIFVDAVGGGPVISHLIYKGRVSITRIKFKE